MTPEKEGELFAKLDMLITMVGGLQTEQRQLGERMARLEGRFDGVDRRLDDQAGILAALVPKTIAAVPGKKAG